MVYRCVLVVMLYSTNISHEKGELKGAETMSMNANTIAGLKSIVGEKYVLTGKEDLLSYGYDATPGFFHLPEAVVIPETTEQVSKIMALVNE